MALYLPDSKTLFVHIPKCGGHWVEHVLTESGVAYRHAKPKPGKSHRHGRVNDYDEDVQRSFATIRNVDDWMLSYWRFHMMAGHNRKAWGYDGDEPHRVLGPPLLPWQEFKSTMREQCEAYLHSMTIGVDEVISMADMGAAVYDFLRLPQPAVQIPRQNVTVLKVELGGGTRSRGDGFANIDIVPEADFEWDLNLTPYPFADGSVDEVYSSHCLEHLECPHRTLHEIARICKVGASVEIRVPHPGSHMAMCAGHRHVFSPMMVDNIDIHFPELHWTGPKRLKLQSLTYGPTPWMQRAKAELPFIAGLDDQTIMRWIPNTCHESVFTFRVQKNDQTN